MLAITTTTTASHHTESNQFSLSPLYRYGTRDLPPPLAEAAEAAEAAGWRRRWRGQRGHCCNSGWNCQLQVVGKYLEGEGGEGVAGGG